MSRRLEVVAAGCVAFAMGALVPWLPTEPAAPAAPVPPAVMDSTALTARDGAKPAAPRRDASNIAIGDERLHSASECLTQRGIIVHPRIIRSVEELHRVLATAASRYAVVHIHVESLDELVDGSIERSLAIAPPGTRVIWSTIRRDISAIGSFSPEERINASIRNVVRRHPDGRLLDWRSALDRHPDWFIGGVGMTSQGCAEYAAKVRKLSGLARGI